ncbi:28638_t:CDS:2 [Dentiscutata erythropus]|uniref:28638_t:CDS:1 n=1 Tax=Dentiscutata erythropus TaxID=1348616 RepID=A0A9N8VHR4_9GLOM|nr:28638_t:CDS:2 [Dentiscutata erythropus]
MPLSTLLEKHIIKSNERLSKSNIKVYCKACVEHLQKCVHFANKITPDEKAEIFALSNKEISNEKHPDKKSAFNSSKSSSAQKVITTGEEDNELSNEIEPESEARCELESEEIENNVTIEDFNDEETVESNSLKEEFSQFLDVWVAILAEKIEESAGIDEDENEEIFSLLVGSVGDIIHPAIDPNTKWDIIMLFNELPLP